MNKNKLILAAAIVCAFIGTTMARPGPGHHGGPGHRGPAPMVHRGPGPVHHHHGYHRPPPPPPSLHGWHRGPRPHHLYRNCWFGGVWYDAWGYPYSSTTVVVPATTTTVVPAATVVPATTTPRPLSRLRFRPRPWFTDRQSKSGSRPGRQ